MMEQAQYATPDTAEIAALAQTPAPGSGAMSSAVSPCVGVCRLDDATGYCLGWARTGDEIAGWKSASDGTRQAVWDALPERFHTLGVSCRRLAYDGAAARRFLVDTIDDATGTWVLGVVGAVGEFTRDADEAVSIRLTGDSVEATTPRAALRLRLDDNVRALSLPAPGRPDGPGRVVMAIHQSKLALPVAETIEDCGEDEAAIDPADRSARLFDLGLGRPAARFCIRTRDPVLIEALAAQCGKPWQRAMAKIGPAIVALSPVRVIETGLGRTEIATPIPPPGGASPLGPHTHLLPDHLATERDVPVGMDIPKIYSVGAIFYPSAG